MQSNPKFKLRDFQQQNCRILKKCLSHLLHNKTNMSRVMEKSDSFEKVVRTSTNQMLWNIDQINVRCMRENRD